MQIVYLHLPSGEDSAAVHRRPAVGGAQMAGLHFSSNQLSLLQLVSSPEESEQLTVSLRIAGAGG